jgi:ABC-2 type transport system ATP-binding protein
VTVLRTEGARTLLALEATADDQAVLRAALATGPVREFRRDVPRLSDLFRHVVTETEEG